MEVRRIAGAMFALTLVLLIGCATERYVEPTITTSTRTGLSLKTPVFASVYDGRTTGADPQAANLLQSELTKIYGQNLEWVPYFDKTPPGRIAVKLRIVTLESTFGSRVISSSTFATAVHSTQVYATGPWGSTVGSATGSSSVMASSFSGEGWWIGSAWVDVEIEDNSTVPRTRFTIPLAAEHKESNTWGYSSGDKAARKAWESVSAGLTRTIDEVLKVSRDAEI